ncbi:MAG: N-6 DNA methylase [Planctomycetia bacterium]|nr:N-6 DNA methylase [Planctomycetia bacterium]
MAKKKPARTTQDRRVSELFAPASTRRRRSLILPKYLADEADKLIHKGERQDQAHEVLKKWAKLESEGHIFKKETAVDADFLLDVFGHALGYRAFTESPEHYELQRNFTVPGIGTADGALGLFMAAHGDPPLVVIEFKDADTDLDRDKFNGRTAVQQCWDYLNALPDCPWGIVSNFVTFRLYHRDKTSLAYEEFKLRELGDIKKFRQFFCLFEPGGLVRPILGHPTRAMMLLQRTDQRQREVGDELYEKYSDSRAQLIQHLRYDHQKSLETAIRVAQKILDRIIFVAFCEDRGLLPEKCIESAYKTLPPFSKVTNPRWQNFLNLFYAIDKGHERFDLKTGYDGGLFEHDDEVDNLQLEDRWTHFFNTIGGYDFRDEVNVEVLGHIFEKSITELEKMRTVGLFGTEGPQGTDAKAEPAMTKSAMRKRFGIFYTPVDFTRFIVQVTVARILDERFAGLRRADGLTPEQLEAEKPTAATGKYWRECLETLRQIKVCDPACGSGAFLIQAYDAFEERYQNVVERIIEHEGYQADSLEDRIPDMILGENLFGIDLSHEAVEITQLALWLRSARRGKTLANLSHNIVCGNSLVTDETVDARAMNWESTFPTAFNRDQRGFDCVIGNPPWERLKLQEREFFAFTAPEIAGSVSAARRRQLIAELERANPTLYASYTKAKDTAERTLNHVRGSGNFPLTGKGDINTYAAFAELARKIVAPHGRVGLLVPSGIATDNTTKEFFAELIESQALVGLYDFENRRKIFADVDGRFKFCTLVFGGSAMRTKSVDFAFFAHAMADLKDKNRHISLTAADLRLINPNTRTCPIFRSRRDAELTKAIYRRVPILIDENRREGGNPWGVKFVRMFDQTNEAELFHAPAQLQEMGFKLQGNHWTKGKQTYLPLYEAKMIQAYDHRAASVVIQAGNWVRQGQTEPTTLVEHQNPEFVAQPRWWVPDTAVESVVGGRVQSSYLAYKDVTSATNQRTMIAAIIPHVAVANSAPLVLVGSDVGPRLLCCLLANLNSLALDFVARQKVGGVHLNFFIVEQLPILPPDRYADRCPWDTRQTLERWISDRVLKLTCTAADMRPLAKAVGIDPPIHKWDSTERAELMVEIDAAFFLLYGVNRADVEYILGTFQGTSRPDDANAGRFQTDVSILDAYDRLSGKKSG